MALKINNFTDESAPGQLNRWAAQHENTVSSHTRQLTQLHTMLQAIVDLNPTLKIPAKK
jgi:hypothetical protein